MMGTMMGTKRVTGAALVVAAALVPGSLQAQRGGGFGGAGGPNMGRSLEVVLEKQQQLNLSQDQIVELQGLKNTLDTKVAPVVDEMEGVRQLVRDGEIDRDEGLRQMQALRGQMITNAAPLQGRVQEILTVEQHRILQSAVRQGRPGGGRGAAGQMRGARVGQRAGGAQTRRIRGGKGPRGGTNVAPRGSFRGRLGNGAAPGFRGRNPGVSAPPHLGLAQRYGRGLGPQPFRGNRGIGGLPSNGI